MSGIEIKKVTTQKELLDFIKCQWLFYKNDPNWVSPLIMDRKKILDKRKNPFFKHADADYFLAYQNGEIKGRIAAIKNDLHNQVHNDKVGFFGFFESVNDQTVANALFNTVKEWLADKGLTHMRGPANPSSNDEYAMLLEGFDDPPRLLMTYNPKYYTNLCDNYGFLKAKDLYAYKLFYDDASSSDKLKRVAEIARKRSKLKIREIDLKKLDEELKKIKFVYDKAWEPNWGFVPLTDGELNGMAKDLKALVEPSLVIFGEIEGKTIGFALVMLDYNQIFKEMNGRLFPFGFLKLFTKKKKINWVRVIILGITPEYQKKGLDAVFYWEIMHRANKLGIQLGEASWILEDNHMINRGMQIMGGNIYKKYRIYEKEI